MKHSKIIEFEIILIDDGSEDGSTMIAQQLSKNRNTKLITHKENLGIGESLKNGYDSAQYEYICAIPGDGQFEVSELLKLQPFEPSEFVSYYRVENTVYSIYRKILTQLNYLFNKLLLNLSMKDVNWIKVYRKSQLDSLTLDASTSIVESEICAKLFKMSCRPIEIPSAYQPRNAGESTAGSPLNLVRVIFDMLPVVFSVWRFKPPLNSVSNR